MYVFHKKMYTSMIKIYIFTYLHRIFFIPMVFCLKKHKDRYNVIIILTLIIKLTPARTL